MSSLNYFEMSLSPPIDRLLDSVRWRYLPAALAEFGVTL